VKVAVNIPLFVELEQGDSIEGQSRILNWLYNHLLEMANQEKEKFKATQDPEASKILPFTGIRIKRVGKTWFAVLSANREEKPLAQKIHSMAVIDPNHKNLGYLVDDQGQAIEIQNLDFVKDLDRRIDQIQRRRDGCLRNSVKIEREDGSYFYKPSQRWKFFQDYLDELRRVRREKIKSALYCISNQLVARYDLIFIGNYTPRGGGISTGMRRSMNNQSQIGGFKKILQWVYQREGKLYSEWDEKNSTKTCAQCNTPNKESLCPSIRIWVCSACKSSHIRDENAALNGFKRVIQELNINQLPGSGHLFELCKSKQIPKVQSRWAWRFMGSGISILRASECVRSQPPRNLTLKFNDFQNLTSG
jgi:putative transposase